MDAHNVQHQPNSTKAIIGDLALSCQKPRPLFCGPYVFNLQLRSQLEFQA